VRPALPVGKRDRQDHFLGTSVSPRRGKVAGVGRPSSQEREGRTSAASVVIGDEKKTRPDPRPRGPERAKEEGTLALPKRVMTERS